MSPTPPILNRPPSFPHLLIFFFKFWTSLSKTLGHFSTASKIQHFLNILKFKLLPSGQHKRITLSSFLILWSFSCTPEWSGCTDIFNFPICSLSMYLVIVLSLKVIDMKVWKLQWGQESLGVFFLIFPSRIWKHFLLFSNARCFFWSLLLAKTFASSSFISHS